mgnify:CR=1 FL=1
MCINLAVASSNIEKKERLIKDEIKASLGGNYAGRFNRFDARKDGIEAINEKFNLDIIVEFYDDIPSSEKNEKKEDTDNEPI